ncbi:MAG: glycoside hydrolase family 5 protein [bacterium]|nr:glycoside hydrolase family 5 protein [bacterium]
MNKRWSEKEINSWYKQQPWYVGCNFIPSTAINQLEMWQEETYDPETIKRELGWAAEMGMNTVRVYLHDIPWTSDPPGFKSRINNFLDIAFGLGIKTTIVIFDDCWNPKPEVGIQPEPVQGKHNSGWMQSPGIDAATDIDEWQHLEKYVRDIVTAFKDDHRILMWDIYNELGNIFLPALSLPIHRKIPMLLFLLLRYYLFPVKTLPLFRKTLGWVRGSDPVQPVTAPIYFQKSKINEELIQSSDVITFHNYKDSKNLKKMIRILIKYNRPLICTEYLSRKEGSRFDTFLPVLKEERIGCYNWGLVSGKTQTIYSWADYGRKAEPEIWFHDIFRKDGTPFDEDEIKFIKEIVKQ